MKQQIVHLGQLRLFGAPLASGLALSADIAGANVRLEASTMTMDNRATTAMV
jgi:hypothetical protein